MTKVENLMHRGAQWVTPQTPVTRIAAMMKKTDVGAIPVGENDRLIGMVTDRDLAVRALADGHDPAKLCARDVMTKGIVYCWADQTVEHAVNIMQERQIRRLPVIDRNKRMVGMLSIGDIAHHGDAQTADRLLRAIAAHHA